jgi:hypothetical protein
MHAHRRLCASLALGAAIAIAQAPMANSQDASAIRDQWTRQQEAVQTAEFTIRATQRLERRSESSMEAKDRNAKEADEPKGSDAPVASDYEIKLLLKGHHGYYRIDSNRAVYRPDVHELVSRVSTFTGGVDGTANFLVTGESYPVPMGNRASSRTGSNEIAILSYRPLMLALRPFERPYVGAVTAENFLSAKLEQGAESLVLFKAPGQTLTVDGQSGTVKRLEILGPRGRLLAALDITNVEIDDEVWIPKEWTVSFFTREGKLRSHQEFAVKHYKLNSEIADTAFQLTFPAGTVVVDNYHNDPATTHYSYVTESGEFTPLAKEVANAVIRSGPEALTNLTDSSPNRTLIIVNLAIIVGLLLVVVRRAFRSSASVSNS